MTDAIASNTMACFSTFFGKRLIGHAYDENGNAMMIFEDGRAFVRAKDAPGFWVVSSDQVRRSVERQRAKLEREIAALSATVALADGLPALPVGDR